MPASLLALVVLLASHPHPKAKPAAKKAAAPAVSVDAAAAKRAAAALGLPADLQARVEKFAHNADAVAKGGTDGMLCSLVDEAMSLGADVHASVADRAPDAAKVEALESATPGLRVGLGPEGGTGGASFASLGRLAAAKHGNAATLLSGASGMLDQKRPAFIVMMKDDERGCTDYSRAQSSIDRLAAGWKSAPACLKERLKNPLSTALADDELSTCWCKDADTAAFETKHYAAKLSNLKDFDGPGHAKAILAESDDASAHFSCNAQ